MVVLGGGGASTTERRLDSRTESRDQTTVPMTCCDVRALNSVDVIKVALNNQPASLCAIVRRAATTAPTELVPRGNRRPFDSATAAASATQNCRALLEHRVGDPSCSPARFLSSHAPQDQVQGSAAVQPDCITRLISLLFICNQHLHLATVKVNYRRRIERPLRCQNSVIACHRVQQSDRRCFRVSPPPTLQNKTNKDKAMSRAQIEQRGITSNLDSSPCVLR